MATKSLRAPRDVLAEIAFFSEVLDPARIEALAVKLRTAPYARGTTLIREDDIGSSMFVIAKGEAEVRVPGPKGGKLVATLGPGEFFGEMSLLTGARRAATVTAKSDVEAIEIPKAAVAPLIATSPELADRFAAMLRKRQKQLDKIYRSEGRWSLPVASDLAGMIRGFFGGTV